MLNTEIDAWSFLGGLRFEETRLETTGNEVTLDGDGYESIQLKGENEYDNLFMNFHARYRFNQKLSMIASFTQTIKRPDYDETAPFRVVDLSAKEVEQGNPNLNPTLFDNYDLSLDYRISSNQLLTIEAFYRTVEDSLYSRESLITSGPYEGFISYTPDNGGSGSLYGFKTTWNHKFLASAQVWLQPLSFSLTYTHNSSESEYPLRPGEKLPIAHTPEHRGLLTLKYNSKPIFIQLGFDYRTETLYSLSTSGDGNDIYNLDSFYINLIVEYTVNDYMVLFMDWSNLNMAFEDERYIGDPSRPYLYKDDPLKILFGARLSF